MVWAAGNCSFNSYLMQKKENPNWRNSLQLPENCDQCMAGRFSSWEVLDWPRLLTLLLCWKGLQDPTAILSICLPSLLHRSGCVLVRMLANWALSQTLSGTKSQYLESSPHPEGELILNWILLVLLQNKPLKNNEQMENRVSFIDCDVST